MNHEPPPLVSAFVFVLGACLMVAGLHLASEIIAPTYPAQKLRMRLLSEQSGAIEVLNAGSSLNRAIDYHHMAARGFHVWDGGADLLEASYVLRVHVPRLPKLKVVLIPLNPLSFRTDNTLVGRGALRRQYYAVTPSLASWRPIRGDVANLVRGKLSSIVREDHWSGVFGVRGQTRPGIGLQQHRRSVDETGYLLPYPVRALAPGGELPRLDELKGFFLELERVVRANPGLQERIYREFAEAVAMVRARGIRVVMFSPPYLDAVNHLFALQEIEQAELQAYAGRLGREYGAEYLDFSSDFEFATHPEYFMSADHLNTFGAAIFSQKLGDRLGFGRLSAK